MFNCPYKGAGEPHAPKPHDDVERHVKVFVALLHLLIHNKPVIVAALQLQQEAACLIQHKKALRTRFKL